jgi:hypothetical protein
MTTDFRALCARLVHELENTQKSLMYHQGCSTILDSIRCAVVDRARAALAEPEPIRPSDDELTMVYAYAVAAAVDNKRGPYKKEDAEAAQLAGLRAVLARWGQS